MADRKNQVKWRSHDAVPKYEYCAGLAGDTEALFCTFRRYCPSDTTHSQIHEFYAAATKFSRLLQSWGQHPLQKACRLPLVQRDQLQHLPHLGTVSQ